MTILLVAMSVVTLFGMAAFVVDHGFARQTTRNEQAAADAGALAAAQDLPKGASPNAALSDVARSIARSYTGQSLSETATGPACAPGATTCTFTAGVHTVTVTTPMLAGAASRRTTSSTCRRVATFPHSSPASSETTSALFAGRRLLATETSSRGLVAVSSR